MPPRPEEDDISPIEHTRESLYNPAAPRYERSELPAPQEAALPHEWQERVVSKPSRHVRFASIFLGFAMLFFLAALGAAGYFFYFGSNSVSSDKITLDVQGPTIIAGGDTVPLSLTITNRNPVALENATIEVDFPEGTRSATDVLAAYPRYIENLGTIASGATVTRSVKAIIFGGAGQTLSIPVDLSYGTANSNAVFEKKSSYALAISSTPLSVSVDSLTETTSGQPITFSLLVRSNATVPMNNIVLVAASPFGFSLTSSSLPFTNGVAMIGALMPGESKKVTLTGVLTGQNNDQRVFHFSVGTATSEQDPTPAITYMTQDASLTIRESFIAATLMLNGNPAANAVLTPNTTQNVSLSYANTLATTITNATVIVKISGPAVNYDSIKTTSGFYNSADHTVIFSKDTDPALAALVPGATGLGSFSFATLAPGAASPTITFTISVSGTRVGQTNVPEQVTTSAAIATKVVTTVAFSARSTRDPSVFAMSGPVPPRAEKATTYAVVWETENKGSTVAGGSVTATVPGYVAYAGKTSGSGSFSYDSVTRTVTWNTSDLPQGAAARGAFLLSLTPSTSQKGGVVPLTSAASFSGYDRFAGVQVTATADPVTTETKGDAGYVSTDAVIQ